LIPQQLVTEVSVVAKKILYGGPKSVRNILANFKPESGRTPTRNQARRTTLDPRFGMLLSIRKNLPLWPYLSTRIVEPEPGSGARSWAFCRSRRRNSN